jgi:cytochrome-b5 reductase
MPILSPEQKGELVLLIKKYETRVMSKYMHEQLKPGDMLTIKDPISKFPYRGMCSTHLPVHHHYVLW